MKIAVSGKGGVGNIVGNHAIDRELGAAIDFHILKGAFIFLGQVL